MVERLIETNQKLRTFLAAGDGASHQLSGSFVDTDPELEALASQLRPALDDVNALVYGFLERLENTPAFVQKRGDALRERERR